MAHEIADSSSEDLKAEEYEPDIAGVEGLGKGHVPDKEELEGCNHPPMPITGKFAAVKWLLWEGGTPFDAFLTAASAQEELEASQAKKRQRSEVQQGTLPSSQASAVADSGGRPGGSLGAAGAPRTSQSGPLAAAFAKTRKAEADKAIAAFFYANGISFNVARSPYLQKALAAVAAHGPGYKAPGSEALRTTLLDACKADVTLELAELDTELSRFGCTIASDGWDDVNRRPLLNILKVTPKGAHFMGAVDTSGDAKSGAFIAEVLIRYIEEIGPENVVLVCTDNAANCKLAGAIIMERYPHITWQPCVAHVMDLFLEDVGKLGWVQPTAAQGRAVIKFVRNHHFTLSTFREQTQLELLSPGETRFATDFLALERLLQVKAALQTMVVKDGTYDEWAQRQPYKEQAADVKKTIMDGSFWDDCKALLDLVGPAVNLLRLADGNVPCMGKLYHGAFKVAEQIKAVDMQPARIAAVHQHWMRRWEMMHSPVMAAAYALDPEYQDHPIDENAEVSEGLLTMAERLLSEEEAVDALVQLKNYRSKEGMFGSSVVRAAAKRMAAFEWWRDHGAGAPALKKLAMKVLSQVGSACSCERSWSHYGFIHSRLRNRLKPGRAEDLVYVFSNLRLLRSVEDREEVEYHVWDLEEDM